jgi:hypothetical protein
VIHIKLDAEKNKKRNSKSEGTNKTPLTGNFGEKRPSTVVGEPTDGWTVGCMDGMDGWMYEWMDWMDGCINGMDV